ncbi:hypothetical protein [Streptosporangium sp. 'caverna']|uniref:hypothetical protein n=1 Tax=Streptosporangium sp. 'caverna' TaxID=2202249 RepID=UPI0013A68EA1|nr:hypothetical protein [Streptosporangium sp. 'caverna']
MTEVRGDSSTHLRGTQTWDGGRGTPAVLAEGARRLVRGKTPQIGKYLVDARIPFWKDEDEPLRSGVAEIWLRNGQERLESLQTPEFLEGARLDAAGRAADRVAEGR